MPQNHYTEMGDQNEDKIGRGWEKPFCIVLISAVFLLGMMSELSVRKAALTGKEQSVKSEISKIWAGTGEAHLTESFAHGLGFFSKFSSVQYVSTGDKRIEMGVKCAGEEENYAMISCGCEFTEGFMVEGSRINGNRCTCRWRNMMEVGSKMTNFSAYSNCVYSG